MGFLWDRKKARESIARDELVLDAIIEWAYSLPDGAAQIDVRKDVLTVSPRNLRAAGFEIFPEHDTEFNLFLGDRQMYPRMDQELAIQLFTALAQGRCQRTLWEHAGRVRCARTEFLDTEGQVFYTYHEGILWPWSRALPRLIRYEAY